MSPLLRYCTMAAGAFVAALVFSWAARLATDGFGALGAMATRDVASSSHTAAPPPANSSAVNPATDASPLTRNVDDVRPIVPARFVALVGEPFELYYDGLVLAKDPDTYKIEIVAPTLKGEAERRRWKFTAAAVDIDRHKISVVVRDWNDKVLAEAQSHLDVIALPNPPDTLNILIVGASNVHQGIYPNALWTRLDRWSGGHARFVGTHHPKPSLPIYRELLPKVFHEGYGGWGWQLFVNHYAPGKEEFFKRTASPFVYLEDGKPVLDVGRYLSGQGVRGKLDVVIFELGINETFAANPDDLKDIDQTIATALGWADQLLAAFKTAAPEARLMVAIPIPFTRSEPTFMARYAKIKPEFGDPWRHRRIVQTLARRMIERYDDRDAAFSLVPLHALFDGVDSFWQIDPGHPNEYGGEQIARALFAAIVTKYK